MYTEETSKTKWCPECRVEAKTWQASYNKYPDKDTELPAQSLCIASDCRMWRWEHDAPAGTSEIGYCGLAGKP